VSLETCNKHDDCVVVYDVPGYKHRDCPLCDVVDNLKTMMEKLSAVEAIAEGDHSDLEDARVTVEELQESLKVLEEMRNGRTATGSDDKSVG
jgi:hypothetical protein